MNCINRWSDLFKEGMPTAIGVQRSRPVRFPAPWLRAVREIKMYDDHPVDARFARVDSLRLRTRAQLSDCLSHGALSCRTLEVPIGAAADVTVASAPKLRVLRLFGDIDRPALEALSGLDHLDALVLTVPWSTALFDLYQFRRCRIRFEIVLKLNIICVDDVGCCQDGLVVQVDPIGAHKIAVDFDLDEPWSMRQDYALIAKAIEDVLYGDNWEIELPPHAPEAWVVRLGVELTRVRLTVRATLADSVGECEEVTDLGV